MFQTVLVVWLCGLAPGAVPAEEGWTTLLATDSLNGWTVEGTDKSPFDVHGGVLRNTGQSNYPTWLRSEKIYENFILRFEYMPSQFAETVLYLHAPRWGRNAEVGMAIRFASHTRPSGILVGLTAEGPMILSNEWRRVEVVMDWPMLRVSVNEQVVTDVNCEKDDRLRYRFRQGYIGIGDIGYPIEFRNIRIKPLASKETWTPMFDGRTFDGWTKTGDADWQIRDGAILATKGEGYLVSKKEYDDFELMTYVRTTTCANSGIFFGWKEERPHEKQGHEIQIYNVPDAHMPTGSLYGKIRADRITSRDNEWFPVQIRVEGAHMVVRVNGETSAVAQDLVITKPGRISLQKHVGRGTIEFRDIRIRPLR